MQRLQRLSPHRLAGSTPLPDVLGLASKFPGAYFRRGQTSLIAAEPNNGKSPLVRWMSVQWALQGLRVLYFSADSDEFTTWKSVAACVSGKETTYVAKGGRDVTASLRRLEGRLAFVFETDPSYQDVMEETAAFWELWGSYPDVIVVDLLADVQGDNEDEYAVLREHTRAFKRIARVTGAHVVMINHVNEDLHKGDEIVPPARARITGKISKKPELVLTLAYDKYVRHMKIAVVKGRDVEGGVDTSGREFLTLKSDPERMQFHDPNTGRRLGVAA